MKKTLLLCFLLAFQTMAYAGRGELLYETHCHACHGPEMHQRSHRIATDWGSLLAQVQRWESNTGLNWSQDEINDVANYLNERYYGYSEPGHHSEQNDPVRSRLQ